MTAQIPGSGRTPAAARPVPLVAAWLSLAVASVCVLDAAPAAAQGWIEPGRGAAAPVVKLRTSVSVEVDGRIARVEVEEWFENRGSAVAEGDYMHPLPGEAVFSDVSLFQGDMELRGETMDAGEARRIYEEIVRQRRDPALIELAGHGLLRARVFPIEPGERRRIILRYTQVLDRSGDALHFRYLAATPTRPGIGSRPGAPGGAPGPGSTPVAFHMRIADSARFGTPFSPTHRLSVTRTGGAISVRPEAELSGEVSVFLPLAEEAVGIALAAHRRAGEEGYFMLTLSPRAVGEARMPRDITVVVDVSGSMAGEKMAQTRRALRQLLESLDGGDRVRLVAFSGRVTANADAWTRADVAGLRTLHGWVDALRAEGATNIDAALEEALRLRSPADRLAIVIFMTDGLPTAGETDPERIAAAAEARRGRARLFAFGVGYDVNTYLLDRLGEAGRGTAAYVRPEEDVELAVGALATRIRHPVLTDLSIDGAPVHLLQLYPERLPDLFAGEELILLGRYRANGTARGEVRVSGRRAGATERYGASVEFPERRDGNAYLPRLWAARKVGALMRRIRIDGPDPELVEEVRRTALRYGILTPYTSHLVQEPMTLAGGGTGAPDSRGGRIRDGALTPMAATSPTSSHGRAAVLQAETDRQRREIRARSDLDALEREAARELASGRAGTAVLAGRAFRRDGEGWIEEGVDGALPTVVVEPFGSAYFEILHRIPELRPVLDHFDRVTLAGVTVNLGFAPGGVERIGGAELARLLKEFRGTD